MIKDFIDKNYLHFNAASLKDAAIAYCKHIDSGQKMFLGMGGAMSTAEMGISLAKMIREDKIHAISCSANNLEEDIFNLVAHDYYLRIPNYRHLTADDEQAILDKHLNRVTDTCIPEGEAFRRIEKHALKIWKNISKVKNQYNPHYGLLPYQFFYALIGSKELEQYYQIDPKNSWVLAAYEKNIPIYTPGWEDSTLGNIFASYCYSKDLDPSNIKSGIHQMMHLIDWYKDNSKDNGIGFFQIGGGIAGDFPICVVPLMRQDLQMKEIKHWSYFCQISDSTTSYGSYSGAVPNEKITWDKLSKETPKFIIESDATIVFPLIAAYVLGE